MRFSFWLRGALPAASRLLASWKLSVVLMLTAATYNAHLSFFARKSPSQVIQNMAALAPFWGVYTLLLLNTAWCLWLRWPTLRRDVALSPLLAAASPSWEVPAPFADAAQAQRELARLGYRARLAEGGAAWGLRHRWSAVGTYLFHGAFFVLAAGFITTLAFREEFRVVVAVGEEFVGAPEQVLSREGSALVTMGPPQTRFTHERLLPEFWEDQLLFTRLESTLTLEGGAQVETAINRPVWLGGATFVRLSGFGYAPRFELRSAQGAIVEESFIKLNVFPPGQQDTFRPGRLPHRFYLQLYPDLVEVDGAPASKTFALVRPGILVHGVRGKIDLGEQLLRGPAEPFAFEGFELRFPEIRYWGEFRILHDPGAPVLALGLLMALVGLAMKLRGRRQEVRWEPEAGGLLRGYGGEAPRGLCPPGRAA